MNLLYGPYVIEIKQPKGINIMVMEKDTNNDVRNSQELANQKAQEIMAEGKRRKNRNTRKTNNLWIWLGVLILIFILVWWLWTIGTFEDITGVTNG